MAKKQELKERIRTLEAQVQFSVDYMDARFLLEEHCFTFPDGETVYANVAIIEGE